MAEERLQKVIARSGLCSRRQADEMIREGRVTVNGRVAHLGERADLDRDHVKVDGRLLTTTETLRYLLLYKPREVVTTCSDPERRTTVVDLARTVVSERVFPVGRLDYQSEGLVILTNDGELAMVNHPRFGLVREYLVRVRGEVSEAEKAKLEQGTTVEGRWVRPRSVVRERGTKGGGSWWRVELSEGRTHEIRELFFRAGHHVQRLKRTAIGPIRDATLNPGELRTLTAAEIRALKQMVRRGRKAGGARVRTKASPRERSAPPSRSRPRDAATKRPPGATRR